MLFGCRNLHCIAMLAADRSSQSSREVPTRVILRSVVKTVTLEENRCEQPEPVVSGRFMRADGHYYAIYLENIPLINYVDSRGAINQAGP